MATLQEHPRRVRPGVRPRPLAPPARSPEAANQESWPRDRGIGLLAMFTFAVLVIVVLTVVLGAVDRWWILIPVMAVHFGVTAAVLTRTGRLLDDGD